VIIVNIKQLAEQRKDMQKKNRLCCIVGIMIKYQKTGKIMNNGGIDFYIVSLEKNILRLKIAKKQIIKSYKKALNCILQETKTIKKDICRARKGLRYYKKEINKLKQL
jgi:hypothetical protein